MNPNALSYLRSCDRLLLIASAFGLSGRFTLWSVEGVPIVLAGLCSSFILSGSAAERINHAIFLFWGCL
jgi:hypothetical protein